MTAHDLGKALLAGPDVPVVNFCPERWLHCVVDGVKSVTYVTIETFPKSIREMVPVIIPAAICLT